LKNNYLNQTISNELKNNEAPQNLIKSILETNICLARNHKTIIENLISEIQTT
jgi:hypothetical protein